VVVLRCTTKLLARLKQTSDLPPAESTTRLGDWYGNLIRLGRTEYLIFISEHSRLAAVLPARNAKRLPDMLPEVVAQLLEEIGVPTADIEDERKRMSPIVFGRTQSQSLLGTMNDYVMMARYGYRDQGVAESPDALMRFLAQTPILPLKGASPIELTRARFNLPRLPPAYWRHLT